MNVRSVDGSSFDEDEDAAPLQAARKSPDAVVATTNPSCGNVFNSLLSASEVITVAGRPYLKLECVGRGGSSRVYRVLADDLGVHALKRVRLSRMEPSALETYRNEIALLRRLAGSRHIVSLIDADIDYESRCIHMVMELGQMDLAAALAFERDGTSGARDDNRIRLLWSQMLAAVNTIHCARIVHSDLKPANFVFVGSVLKLIDFGIAKAISADTTNIVRDSQVGTVNYMSPEAISAGGVGLQASRSGSGTIKLGRASDIWSLGCILYQIVYGRTPFAELSLIHKLQAICDPTHTLVFPPLDPPNTDLLDVMQACLQRDPLKRPTISGAGGLLEHPFLCPTKPRTTAAAGTITLSRDEVTALATALLTNGAALTPAVNARDIATKVADALCTAPRSACDAGIESVISSALKKTRPTAPAFAAAAAAAAATGGGGKAASSAAARAPLRPVSEKAMLPLPRAQSAPDAENRAPLPVAISANVLKAQAAALKRPTPVPTAEPAPKEQGLVGLLREGLADRFNRLSARLEDTNQGFEAANADSTFG
jgi:serine/threonine-protein kinase TTK/MPS1